MVGLGSPVESRRSWTELSTPMSATPGLAYTQSSSSLSRVANLDVISVVAAPLDEVHGMDARVLRAYPPLVSEPKAVELTTIRL